MKVLRAYLPLALRPGVLLGDVFVAAGMAVMLALVAATLSAALTDPAVPGHRDLHTPELAAALVLLLAPAAFGVVAADPLHGLVAAHVSWTAPSARRSAARALAVLALAGAVGGALWSGAVALDAAALPVRLALAFLAFAAGVTVFDPTPPRALARTTLLALVAAALAAEPLVRAADAFAPLAVPLALLGGTALLARVASAVHHRRTLVAATSELGVAWTCAAEGGSAAAAAAYTANQRARLADSGAVFPARPAAGGRGWIRAALYESTGGATASRWLAQGLILPVVLAAFCFLGAFQDGLEEGSARTGLAYAAAALFRTEPGIASANQPPYHLVALIVAMAATFATLSHRLELRGVTLYPLARRSRAALAFRTAVLQDAGIVAQFGLPFALLAEGLVAATPVSRGADLVPWYARAILIAVLLLPMLHGARDRWYAWMEGIQMRQAAFLVAAFCVTTLGIQVGDEAWRALDVVAGPVAPLAAWLALAVAGRALHRSWLGHWWARRDLA